MGNAIRWLKDCIIKIDPAVPEATAKEQLVEEIDAFIQERIIAADAVISEAVVAKIYDGDVILTYGHSSIVAKTLLAAALSRSEKNEAGVEELRAQQDKSIIPFRVIVVDSRPLFEGKKMARRLAAAGIRVDYVPLTGATHAVSQATRVLLGAHAMLSNGRLYARSGTAAVAMLAHARDIPVIVCCQSVKFTDRVALDSIVVNEVAPAEELLSGDIASKEAKGSDLLGHWRKTPNLQVLNLMYDVTPAEYIQMVVTEYGSLPPSSVPVVHRLSTNG